MDHLGPDPFSKDVSPQSMKIKAKLNPLVQEMKDKMRLEVFDAVFSGSALSEPPDWATMIDGAKVDTTVNRIGECMSLEVDTPESGLDVLMKDLEEIMSGPVEDILKQISQQHIDYMLSKIPMGRFGEVDEAAALVAWLASEECSFTTGGVFDLSGGRATY